ncbi:sugar phosphate isomerase/epimerase family protein [Ruminococcus flavefaciens]|uniref:sugar phosphate isomerase/epimerase family protein n=1 Tax=Ruminococcus flavefaciens TaxID=1265 RepID=UPI0002D77DB6|nr:sugar phosphate isomerase/epimerase [Ruminococcus flavefaciens]
MKLSISNIAWSSKDDETVYNIMKRNGFTGLEIAPTRIIPATPYDNIGEAAEWFGGIRKEYGFRISSMQSIWYGRTEKLFGTPDERQVLLDYTKKAVDFAAALDCGNLVFGCPKNRCVDDNSDLTVGIGFFRALGEYAVSKKTVIGMEANPAIYQTNYINTTASALELIREIGSAGIKLNLDLGTVIENKEDISVLKGNVGLINHVHISEPFLAPICERGLHRELMSLLLEEGYDRYISIEMKCTDDIDSVTSVIKYVSEVFS